MEQNTAVYFTLLFHKLVFSQLRRELHCICVYKYGALSKDKKPMAKLKGTVLRVNILWDALAKPLVLGEVKDLNFTTNIGLMRRKSSQGQENNRRRQNSIPNIDFAVQQFDREHESIPTEILTDRGDSVLHNKLLEFTNTMKTTPRLPPIELRALTQTGPNSLRKQLFDELESEQKERIRKGSPYGELRSWSLVHMIVKTGDNLKQQQFALQLIQQFDVIFRHEGLPLLLTPYEVVTMGQDCGVIEMVRDSITFDKLKRILRRELEREYTLAEFFQLYYGQQVGRAKELFLRSLAAYSLVTYFLQAKDRHNGNILLHESGKLFHIDFGFFLSNMPGRGIELQRDVPFKLLSEHIDLLDGPESPYFRRFRELVFHGFKCVRKHQNRLLMLVKLMYSSSGPTMSCFEKGEAAITALEDRLNPRDVSTDAQLNLHCQTLIDRAIDHRKGRWYDYWQYYVQGIFY